MTTEKSNRSFSANQLKVSEPHVAFHDVTAASFMKKEGPEYSIR